MVHRDIKPANILLTQRGQAVLADFGIAQIVGGTRHTVSGALLGTLNYMAPEQGLKGISDVRSDLYSLGVVLYEMLTRRPPFDADTPLAILLKHVNDPLPLPRQLNPDIPAPLERIVLKALAKEQKNRFQSAEEMAEALQKAAVKAKIDLPNRISRPLSFSTQDAPAESVAVYSGAAREKLADVEFAAQDTAATRLEDFAPDLAALKEEEPPVSRVAANPTPPRRLSVWRSIMNGALLITLFNLVIIMFSGRNGPGGFFEQGWPVELLLLAMFFFKLMISRENIWLFIPGGLLFGEAVLMSYYSVTNNWDAWAFLWPLQIFVIVAVLWYTINRAAPSPNPSELAVSLGNRFYRFSIFGIAIVSFFAVVIG
jgi:serine/threonine protein kinase